MRIAVAQTDILWEQVPQNLEILRGQSALARAQGADLVLFPEMAVCGYSMRSLEMAKACQGVPEALLAMAQEEGLWVGTSYPEQREEASLPSNTFALAGPQGQWICYRKMHPFSLAKEDSHYCAGDRPVNVDIAGLRCSLWVCYDLRFANAFWAQAPHTDLYLVLANWPAKRRRAWNTLLRARAIENQAFVAGCNRVGKADGLVYSGDSCIIDPVGRTLARATGQPALLLADLDAALVGRIRSKLPFLQDRRDDF